MSDLQAWCVLIFIVIFVWPVASIVLFDDSCRRGFAVAYKDHLLGWLVLVSIGLVISLVVFGFLSAIEVLIK